MANIWDQESVSEYDLISEDAQNAEELAEEYASKPTIAEADDTTLEEIAEESAFDLDKKESNVIYNARLRLEQAKLYEMLINHNLFDGVDASPEAINNVQNELKFYIVKRLEILLGIREPMVKAQMEVQESPLNDVEVDFLKQLAYKGTLGASASGKPIKPQPQVIKPIPASPGKTLKSLSAKSQKVMPVPTPQPSPGSLVRKNIDPTKKTIISKSQPSKNNIKIRDSGMGRTLTEKEAELIAKEDLAKNPPKKPFNKMTAKEKAARIKEVNEKYKRPTPTTGVKAMPSANELEMKYINQEANRSLSKNQTEQFNTVLANALAVHKNNRNRGEEENE